ncbi:hypothetical protein SBA4_4410003 [Candidatus Sulfopaludibacter sp. SbA4]|nr:hypothetical protein SBA4_4410003 [Candidatus Sulfopaludibacter sp. SbA4]
MGTKCSCLMWRGHSCRRLGEGDYFENLGPASPSHLSPGEMDLRYVARALVPAAPALVPALGECPQVSVFGDYFENPGAPPAR